MSELGHKESNAMARARELNRTNEKRLSECIDSMAEAVERKLEKLKVEGRTTLGFLQRLKVSSGRSQAGVEPLHNETREFEKLLNPVPSKLSFAKVDYKQKKLTETSNKLSATQTSPACAGNPLPLRKVHPWTSDTAKKLSRKKPPTIPPGRRRHSLGSDENSSDEDSDDLTPLRGVKKRAGQIRKKAAEIRRCSLPAICEHKPAKSDDTDDIIDRKKIKASLTKLKQRSMSLS